MRSIARTSVLGATAMLVVVSSAPPSLAQQAKPNIILLVSDDTGYGDLGPYGGSRPNERAGK